MQSTNAIPSQPTPSSHFFPHGFGNKRLTKQPPNKQQVAVLASPNARIALGLSSELEWFWGKGELLAPLKKDVQLAAKHDIHSLITGESGSGKEVLAREIHLARCQRLNLNPEEAPFIAVNCAAIPEGLAESLLFGHERGAFTSAREKQAGKFEQAQGGTLFLDEIQNLPLPLQAKLLRVLQSGELDRLGSKKPVKLNAKIIAASNVPLDIMVDRGLFRRDLHFRLNIAPLLLPPLRARIEDLEVISNNFIKNLSKKYSLARAQLTDDFLDTLTKYKWPGNLRELEHAILYALLRKDPESTELRSDSLPPTVLGFTQNYINSGSWDLASLPQKAIATQPF